MTWRLEDNDDDDDDDEVDFPSRPGRSTPAPRRPLQQALESLMEDGNRLPAIECPALLLSVLDANMYSRRAGVAREIVVARPTGGTFEDVIRLEPYGLFVVSSSNPDDLRARGVRFRQDTVTFLRWSWLESVSLVNVSLVDGIPGEPGLAREGARIPLARADGPGPVTSSRRDPASAGALLADVAGGDPPPGPAPFRDALPGLIEAGNRVPPGNDPSIVVVQRPVDGLETPGQLVAARPPSGRFEDVVRVERGGVFVQGSTSRVDSMPATPVFAFVPWEAIASAWLDHGGPVVEPWTVSPGP